MSFSAVRGNIWTFYDQKEWIAIPTNGFVKKNGELVMGAGLAKQASMKFPGLQWSLGQAVVKFGNVPLANVKYHMLTIPTKHNWTEESDISLIEESLRITAEITQVMKIDRLYMPKVGCGNGKRNWAEVEPIAKGVLEKFQCDFVVCIY